MTGLASRLLPLAADELAPDGSEVRHLCRTAGGSMAHFRFRAGTTSHAVVHRSVAELWYVEAGRAELWRAPVPGASGTPAADGPAAEILPLVPGMSFEIPVGCAFQIRVEKGESLDVVAVTLPPWPGEGETERVNGPWQPDPASSGHDQHR